jgi:hypothetical protein
MNQMSDTNKLAIGIYSGKEGRLFQETPKFRQNEYYHRVENGDFLNPLSIPV